MRENPVDITLTVETMIIFRPIKQNFSSKIKHIYTYALNKYLD